MLVQVMRIVQCGILMSALTAKIPTLPSKKCNILVRVIVTGEPTHEDQTNHVYIILKTQLHQIYLLYQAMSCLGIIYNPQYTRIETQITPNHALGAQFTRETTTNTKNTRSWALMVGIL